MTELKPKPFVIDAPVAGYLFKAKKPKGQVLLQHGYGEYTQRYVSQYSNLIPKLVAKGFDVYGIDLEGHGNTAGERGLIDVELAVKHHLLARKAMPKNLPTQLFGHSLGGLVTAGSLIEDQDNVAAAIISSSAMQTPSKLWERSLAKVMTAIAPSGPLPLPRPGIEALTRDQELLKIIDQDAEMFKGKAKNKVAKTTLAVSDGVWEKAGSWKVPTLFIHGDQDTSTNHENSISLHGAIGSKDKTLKIYAGGFHELLNDVISAEVEKDLFDWLDARSEFKS